MKNLLTTLLLVIFISSAVAKADNSDFILQKANTTNASLLTNDKDNKYFFDPACSQACRDQLNTCNQSHPATFCRNQFSDCLFVCGLL